MKMHFLPAALVLLASSAAWSGPGAHGPGGEHLDTPGANASAATQPRLEAKSESFELVARLLDGELSILVDRFETNEPVLGARLEVESRGLKSAAKFHADHGDYAVDDAAMLKALSSPGEHPIVFTLIAANESDLLEGTLVVGQPADEHHDRPWWHYGGIGLAVLLLMAAAAAAARSRHRRAASQLTVLAAVTCTAVLSIAGPGAHGPGGEHLDGRGGSAQGSSLARLPDGSVNVPKLAQRRMEIRTVLAPEREVAATVELPGRVVMDPNAGGRVQPAYGGRIEPGPQGLPVAGKTVRKGEVLAYLRHHGEPFAIANQQSQVAEVRAARQIAEQRVRRLEGLEGTVARKDIEAARTELQGLVSRERSLGQSLDAREALIAPVSGVIARADAVAGQVVQSGDLLFEIVDPQRLLVEGTTADVALAARLGPARLREVPGVVLEPAGVARSLREGVLPVTFRASTEQKNVAIPLAVGQAVTVVASLAEKAKGIVLPAASVVRGSNNEPVVWVKVGAERFVPQPVKIRPLDAQTLLVTKGLAPDNRVVVQGAALIAQIR